MKGLLVHTSRKEDDVRNHRSRCCLERPCVMSEGVLKLRKVYETVLRSYSSVLMVDSAKTLEIDIAEYKRSSLSLCSHLPKPYEMRVMNTTPGLWSDLFNTEVFLLCNRLLLDTNIELSNIMKAWALKINRRGNTTERTVCASTVRSVAVSVSAADSGGITTDRLYNDPIFIEIQQQEEDDLSTEADFRDDGVLDAHSRNSSLYHTEVPGDHFRGGVSSSDISRRCRGIRRENSLLEEENAHHRDSSIAPNSDEHRILKIINGMIVFNERLSDEVAEPRAYYNHATSRLFYLTEERLLQREEVIKRERGKVLQFLKQLSRTFDIDKCTHNLAILYFDSYIHQSLESGSLTVGELDYNTLLKISTAAYLLAAALREHWIDISRDTYLEHAVNRSCNAFLAHDVVITQLDILQSMPKGFSNIYVAMEYGLFYLANIRGNFDPLNRNKVTNKQSDVGTAHQMRDNHRNKVASGSSFVSSWHSQRSYQNSSSGNLPFNSEVISGNFNKIKKKSAGRHERDPTYENPHKHTNISDTLSLESMGIFDDYLLLNTAFRFILENGGFAWLYHCLSKWDDLYVAKNWNRFIPPSRVSAVLIFHFFVDFYNINHEVHLIWCRRFCFKVFKMYYDTDLALWYKVFRENIKSFLLCIEKSSQRLHEMATLFQIAAHKFRSVEACCYAFWTKVIVNIWDTGHHIQHIKLEDAKIHLSHLLNIVVE